MSTDERALERLTEEELLRLLVISRDGNRTQTRKAQAAWKALVARDIDRIRGIASAFRFPENASVRVAPDDVDAVTQDAYIRLAEIAFKGESVGEYRALMRTCVRFECMDHCRAELAVDRQRAGSFDEEVETGDGDTRARYDAELAELERRRLAEEADFAAEVERLAEQRDRLTSLIARLEDEKKRKVLEMTIEGAATKEIADALGTSDANVYQLRKRGLELVRKMLDGEDA